jgi:hypothetical protein
MASRHVDIHGATSGLRPGSSMSAFCENDRVYKLIPCASLCRTRRNQTAQAWREINSTEAQGKGKGRELGWLAGVILGVSLRCGPLWQVPLQWCPVAGIASGRGLQTRTGNGDGGGSHGGGGISFGCVER